MSDRITTADAATRLGVTPQTVREYKRLGFLTGRTRSGEETDRGGWYWFDSGEVEAFARGGAPAAKAYRESQDGNSKPKRGRRVAAR